MSTEKALSEIETFFTALADKTRLRLLNLMREEEICVCFFTETLDESQPKVSRHLAYLRKAGLVEARREGKWMHYRIREPEDPGQRRLLRETLNWLAGHKEMRREYERLAAVCCAPDAPVTIARAPKPEALLPETEAPSAGDAPLAPEPEEALETFLL